MDIVPGRLPVVIPSNCSNPRFLRIHGDSYGFLEIPTDSYRFLQIPRIKEAFELDETLSSSQQTVSTVPFVPPACTSSKPRDLSEVTNRRVKTATAAKDGGPSARTVTRDASSSDAAGSQPHRAIPEDPVFSQPTEVDTMDFKVRFAPGNSFSLRGREYRPIPPLGPQDHQQGCPSDLLSRLDFSDLEML